MDILTYTLDEWIDFFKREFGKGRFHAEALFRAVHRTGNPDLSGVPEFTASGNLADRIGRRLTLKPGRVVETQEEEGLTKFITRLADGLNIESVIIPMTGRHTLCVSSQAGCRMGCRFCETGKAGLKRNLTVSEILGQLFNARFVLGREIKNIVFMGMGEPFDNFGPVIQAVRIMTEQKGFDIALRHITISTAGLVPGIVELGRLGLKGLRLAVSINAPDDDTRSRLMPVNRRYSMQELKSALSRFPLEKKGCFLLEYILIKGVNDSETHARLLAEYIDPLPVRLNLIPLNPVDGFAHDPPDDGDMHRFAQILMNRGIFVVKRWSRGRSVSAGCGQLGRSCGPATSSLGAG